MREPKEPPSASVAATYGGENTRWVKRSGAARCVYWAGRETAYCINAAVSIFINSIAAKPQQTVTRVLLKESESPGNPQGRRLLKASLDLLFVVYPSQSVS